MSTEDARAWISKLGALESSRAVADFLEAEGIVGDISNPRHCPVANLLMHKTGTLASVGTGTIRTTLWAETTPEVVSKFIEEFDVGLYPMLCTQWVRNGLKWTRAFTKVDWTP